MESARLRRIDSNRSPAQALVQVSKSRPRASGGHPRSGQAWQRDATSSPRERGSSGQQRHVRDPVRVVPARAGVILHPRTDRPSLNRRPRASGGHPSSTPPTRNSPASSPRERGSSDRACVNTTRSGVVPARAGVIPPRCPVSPRRSCRPRASGGHPVEHVVVATSYMSSPRERGSSVALGGLIYVATVVPARAGVIRCRSSATASSRRRPRASGGHPATLVATAPTFGSSPRERGSSGAGREPDDPGVVVPARAGVILWKAVATEVRSRRPRASGGHPTAYSDSWVVTRSSPRERGSSSSPRR